MSSQATRRARGNRQTLIIGFDFGTHSTKVVVRERGQPGGSIAHFDQDAEGYPRHASPSLVRCVDARFYFGTEALKRHGGKLFRSLKVSLLPQVEHPVGSFSDELDSPLLVAAYFAWAFQKLRESLKTSADASVFINIAAPMGHFESPELKNRYLQIIQAAWHLSSSSEPRSVHQGIAVSSVAEMIGPLLKEPVIGPELRRFEVLPETIAPVVSLSLDPWMKPGMYMIIDTGAGTTEMSVFHVGESGIDQKVLCYRDETMLLGGNDLQLAERHAGPGTHPELDAIISRLKKQYGRIWQLGYQLDAPNHLSRRRWQQLTLVLSGGGTRHESVAAHLSGMNPMRPWPQKHTDLTVCRHVPGTLDLDPEMDEDDGSMFAVANGLAIERRNWPVVFQPDQVEPLSASEEVADKPQGYWYLDAK